MKGAYFVSLNSRLNSLVGDTAVLVIEEEECGAAERGAAERGAGKRGTAVSAVPKFRLRNSFKQQGTQKCT